MTLLNLKTYNHSTRYTLEYGRRSYRNTSAVGPTQGRNGHPWGQDGPTMGGYRPSSLVFPFRRSCIVPFRRSMFYRFDKTVSPLLSLRLDRGGSLCLGVRPGVHVDKTRLPSSSGPLSLWEVDGRDGGSRTGMVRWSGAEEVTILLLLTLVK